MATKKKKEIKKVIKKTAQKAFKKVAKKVSKSATKKATKQVAKKPILKTASKSKKKQVKSSAKKAKSKVSPKINKPVKTSAKINSNMISKKMNSKAAKPNIDYSKVITPLGDRLVVRVVNSERLTPGGLIIPDTAASIASGYLKAAVLAVGHGSKTKKGHLQPLDVKVGDTVLFSEYSGTKVTFNSEELQIIHEADVMGIVQN